MPREVVGRMMMEIISHGITMGIRLLVFKLGKRGTLIGMSHVLLLAERFCLFVVFLLGGFKDQSYSCLLWLGFGIGFPVRFRFFLPLVLFDVI